MQTSLIIRTVNTKVLLNKVVVMTQVKFLNLKRLTDQHNLELKDACARVIDSGMFILGSEVSSFERTFSAFCGTQHAIGVASGLDALSLIFRAWKICGKLHDGDEVIIQANAYIACVLAITENNLCPVFVEPDEKTYNLDPVNIVPAITSKTKVIMPVHLYGQISEMDRIKAIASEHHLLILEDCSQSHGAMLGGIMCGNWGDAAAFSCYPSKNLAALGDAGVISTNDCNLAAILSKLRNYGSRTRYYNLYQGINSRLSEVQAALLNVKMKYIDSEIELRREIAQKYRNCIKNDFILLPETDDINKHTWHLFVIRCQQRDTLQAFLLASGIETYIHYPVPPYKQEAYPEFNHLSFPLNEKIHDEVLSLPIDPYMEPCEIDYVITKVNEFSPGRK